MRSRLRRRNEEAGYAALLVALLVPTVFLGVAALAVDTARWYVEAERVQKAADAAALAGVTFLPQDLDDARTMALDLAARNGFDDGAAGVSVDVRQGARPSQLEVTVSSTVKNTFGNALGIGSTTITRSATTDFNGPAPMGSPCNTMGNEPPGTPGAGPVASQIGAPAGANCPAEPQFWMTAAGPEVYKTQGDRYGVRVCAGNESGCEGRRNTEYKPEGYFLMVRVQPEAVGRAVRLQIYDPAYVDTDSRCTSAPRGSDFPNGLRDWNPYATEDGNVRYRRQPGQFCTGDNDNAGQRAGAEVPTVTSFGLRAPTQTYDPIKAAPIAACTAQYPGYSDLWVDHLRENKGNNGGGGGSNPWGGWWPGGGNGGGNGDVEYDPAIARVFHQWVDLCTFVPTEAGDHYLQVRTNVRLGGAPDATGAYRGSLAQAVYTQTGDDTTVKGNGSNRFSVRAVTSVPTAVSVSSWGDMPIFANANEAEPEFNLIRILPSAAGKNLLFEFFDVGDAASSATLRILRPGDATGSPLTGCRGEGYFNGALTNCQITGIRNSAGWDGKAQTLVVPIPTNYSCNYTSAGGCWFRIRVNFGSGSVTDQTTWSATVTGDPVRLVE